MPGRDRQRAGPGVPALGSLSFFSTSATVGTARDVAQEVLRMESFHPVDERTAAAVAALRRRATEPGPDAEATAAAPCGILAPCPESPSR